MVLILLVENLLLKLNWDQASLLILLDLSVASDTVDCSILIHQLEYEVGVRRIVLW